MKRLVLFTLLILGVNSGDDKKTDAKPEGDAKIDFSEFTNGPPHVQLHYTGVLVFRYIHETFHKGLFSITTYKVDDDKDNCIYKGLVVSYLSAKVYEGTPVYYVASKSLMSCSVGMDNINLVLRRTDTNKLIYKMKDDKCQYFTYECKEDIEKAIETPGEIVDCKEMPPEAKEEKEQFKSVHKPKSPKKA